MDAQQRQWQWRGSRTERPKIAMFINWLTGLHRWQWLGAADSARAHGIDLVCFSGKELGHPDHFYSHAGVVFDLVRPDRFDGLIVWTTTLQSFVGREAMEAFCHRFDPLPMVSVEQSMQGAAGVLVDERQGMRDVVNHLIDVHGHRRIAFVRGPLNHPGAEHRFLGYVDALQAHGLAIDSRLISAPLQFWRPEEAAAATEDLLDKLGTSGIEAIATANDDLAIGAIWAMQRRGIRVPADIAVVGFDDAVNVGRPDIGMDTIGEEQPAGSPRLINATTVTMPLTTVRSPIYQLAWRSVEMMLARLSGDTSDESTIPARMIVRRSCGCLPAASADETPGAVHGQALASGVGTAVGELPAGWDSKLLAAFSESGRSGDVRPFLYLLDQFIQSTVRNAGDLSSWWPLLWDVRRQALAMHEEDDERRGLDSMWRETQAFMWDWLERLHIYEKAIAEKRDQIVRHVGQKLITTRDIAHLTQVLVEELPTIGVTSCYMALYEPPAGADVSQCVYPTPLARAVLCYDRGRRLEIPPDAAVFPSSQLMPHVVARGDAPRSLVVAPLYFQDRQLGFVVMEGGVREGWIYEALRAQLSSAVQGALMVDREKRALVEVDRARARAEEANQAKSIFLATMSHELRTPLNGILGYAQILQHAGNLTPLQSKGLRTIQESGEHLLALITDILDLAKIDAAKLDLSPGLVELPDLIRVIADIIRVKAEEKDLLFELEVSVLPPVVLADERRLRQVLLNLLGNAVKFTDAGKVGLHVDCRVRPHGRCLLRFEVCDSGVGIDPDDLQRIFLAFEQVGDASRRATGSGLGLAISQQLVRLMGSEIVVKSKPGLGSNFSFEVSFPIVATKEQHVAVQGGFTGYEGGRRRVLVVDDVAGNRTFLADLLGPLGFEVEEAIDGQDALDRAADWKPDIVLMDIVMPTMDGLEATRRLRSLEATADLPVIALSANATAANRSNCMAAGASAFLTKPVDPHALLHEIGKALGIRWHSRASEVSTPVSVGDLPTSLPLEPDLVELHRIAQSGNMREVKRWADTIASRDPDCKPFADHLRQLADGFESRAILTLASKYLRQRRLAD